MKHKSFLSLCASLLYAGFIQAQVLAFPGAEGFGAYATGGRDSRTVVHVTNLNATGAGSLTEALNGNNRIVVFDVGGIIKLTPSQMVAIDNHDNITVLGQTAPGDGITIYGNRVLIRNCNNVIFRYIRMRGSINMAKDAETLTMDNANNVILDHCSISWGRWDNVHIKDANNITWQYCIISEGIDPQRFGAITDGTRNWTISHCLWIDNHSRNPKMKCYAQMINSVVYNGGNGVVGGHSAADNYQDLINNYFIAGPSGNSAYSQWTETDHLYQSGNMMDSNKDGILNGTLYTNTSCTNMAYPHFAPDAEVSIETAEEAYKSVLEQAGCSRIRDSHDARLINQLKSLGKEGNFIDSEDNVGGIGTLNGGTAPIDSDNDGIPDEWETENGLNPADAADATKLADDGYLWIEKYANSLAAVTSYLLPPSTLKATTLDNGTRTILTWTNVEDRATSIFLEQSNDGENYTVIETINPGSTAIQIKDLNPNKVYYFRLRTTDGTKYSNYSQVVIVNEPEGTTAGGGTAAGTKAFIPEPGKLYRIISYTSKYYNSGADYSGNAQYLKPNNHILEAVTDFDWEDPTILWSIHRNTSDTTLYTLQAYSARESLAPAVNSNEYAYTVAGLSSEFNITYIGDQTATQSGSKTALAFYRINSPDNKNWQLRGKSANQWLWGNGTIARADMAFTFQAIDSTLVPAVYTKSLKEKIAEAEALLKTVKIGTATLEYPDSAKEILVGAIENADNYIANYKNIGATQADIDSVTTALGNELTAFSKLQNTHWGEYDPSKYYVIYSYGTASNSGTSAASSTTARRYLADYGDRLVFRIGLTDANEASDSLFTSKNAQWIITTDTVNNKNNYWAKNRATGRYIDINSSNVTVEPATLYPIYNDTDNGKYAFSLYASSTNSRSLSIGEADTDNNGGFLQFFNGTADRTRLRWIFEPAGESTIDGISEVKAETTTADKWYDLEGRKLSGKNLPAGVYIHNGKKIIIK